MSDSVTKHDERVRLRAYHLWEKDGRPHGRNDEYWLVALQQVKDEEGEPDERAPGQDPERP